MTESAWPCILTSREKKTDREILAAWVGREILPHEAALRAWLLRTVARAGDVEDIVQECYCRLSLLDSIDTISAPRAYLFMVARNVALQQMRRARIVRIEALTEIDTLHLASDAPSPERIASGRQELARVRALIAALPDRCRQIVEMRKIEGLSQKEIAQRLGVSERIVENEASRGLRAVLRQLIGQDPEAPSIGKRNEPGRKRR